MRPEIIKESPVLLAEVRESLEALKSREELNFRATKTYDHAISVNPLPAKKARELCKKIMGLEITRLRERECTKLVDCMPRTIDDVKVILQSFALTLKEDQIKKIIECVDEARK